MLLFYALFHVRSSNKIFYYYYYYYYYTYYYYYVEFNKEHLFNDPKSTINN